MFIGRIFHQVLYRPPKGVADTRPQRSLFCIISNNMSPFQGSNSCTDMLPPASSKAVNLIRRISPPKVNGSGLRRGLFIFSHFVADNVKKQSSNFQLELTRIVSLSLIVPNPNQSF